MIREEMKIDMNNKTVTVGDVIIDMAGGIITIGANGNLEPVVEEVEEVEEKKAPKVGVGYETSKTCSKCGMLGTNKQTCESTFDEETGEWIQKHRDSVYRKSSQLEDEPDELDISEVISQTQQVNPIHKPITAEQKAQFNSDREAKEGEKVLIGTIFCTVTKHIKGSLYQVKAQEQRASNSGGLPTTVNVMRYASHNKAKNIWSWWENREGQYA